jgi:hypothetical protein
MAQIIRAYDNPKAAATVVNQLKAANFNQIEQVSDGNGGAVVAVEPPFGQGSKAEAILDSVPGGKKSNGANGIHHSNGANGVHHHAGRPTGVPQTSKTTTNVSPMDESTRLTGAPRLAKSKTTSEALGLPTLISSNTFITGIFPLLISSGPWSSLSSNQNGKATLINDPAPLSHSIGLPVLTKR